jgi:hypothetical protein
MRIAEWGMRIAEWGMGNAECGLRIGEWGMGMGLFREGAGYGWSWLSVAGFDRRIAR